MNEDERESRENREGEPMYEGGPVNPYESAHNPRTWRACCLAPIIAIIALLVLSIGAGLYSPQPRFPQNNEPAADDPESLARRESFVGLGQSFFGIADRADKYNETAFQELDAFIRDNSTIDRVNASFAEAGIANTKAAEEYKALQIPENLLDQDGLRKSLDSMSESYNARRRACDILSTWNGDLEDEETANRYQKEVRDINRLTMDGLRQLGEAATTNGLTQEDVERFLPANTLRLDLFAGDAILPRRR